MKELTAFPFVASDKTGMIINTGMNLRDFFAAKALQGMLAETSLKATVEEFANKSYVLADAMMEARK